jgi:hypothetical protein
MDTHAPQTGSRWRRAVASCGLFMACVVLFGAMSYGGIRSPDSEIVFRVALAVAERGEFDVEEPLIRMGEFGLSRGVDGRLYTFYGPAQAVACVPLVWLGRALDRTGWYASEDRALAPSFYVGEGLASFGAGSRPDAPAEHGLRMVVCSFNVFVSSLGVVLMWAIARRFGCSSAASLVGASLYAFGSLTWAYSGTFFKEPLCIVFASAAFLLLCGQDERVRTRTKSVAVFALAGLSLGLAMASHITAAQLFPFLLAYCIVASMTGRRFSGRAAVGVTAFVLGFGAVLALLGWFNVARFGDLFETGRRAGQGLPDEALYMPWSRAYWRVISGLLVGSGKGLLLYCPVVILGVVHWRVLHRRHRLLSWILIALIVSRILGLGVSSGWHGGFCLGPRYLLPLLPFLFLPICMAIDSMVRRGRRRALGWLFVIGALLVCHQLYLNTGEIFSYSHIIKWHHERAGIDVFVGDRLFLDWKVSPLLYLLKYQRGPYLLQGVGVSNLTTWLILSGVACAGVATAYRLVCRAAGWQAPGEE